jgi:uncharacterized protein (DUF302 family)
VFRIDPSVMSNLPLRVLIYVDAAGTTNLAVDQPSTLFDDDANPDVSAVGRDLDRLLSGLLERLGATPPTELSRDAPRSS